jgi:hypothetical protein
MTNSNGMEARSLLEQAGGRGQGTMLDESYNAQVVRKWSDMDVQGGKVNFLRDLDPQRAKVAALCLENQARFLRNLNEDTLSTNSGSFQKYIFPVVRRLFPNLILNDIATVQPMTGPQGAMFTLEYRYDDRKGTKRPWGGIALQPYQMGYEGALAASDDAIKNFAKNYANEYVDYDAVCTDTGAAPATLSNTDLNCRVPAWWPIRAPGTSGQRTFAVTAVCRVTDAAVPVVGAYTSISTKAAATAVLTDQYAHATGTLDISTGAWTVNALLIAGGASTFVANTVIYLQYWVNSELTYTVTGNRLQRMSLNLTRHDIVAEPWRLSAAWSLDAAQDLRAQQGMDLEAEMVAGIANEIGCEIDRTGIDMMINGAAHAASYAYAGTWPGDMEKIHTAVTYIDALSAAISKAGGRGPATFVVAGPEASALLGQLGAHTDWASNMQMQQPASHGDRNTNYPIKRVGSINGKYTLYENPWQDSTKVLVGYKGGSWLDAGFGYAPYIPLYATDTWTDPDTLIQKKGMASRGALKLLRSEYYGVLTLTGLPTVTSTLA